MVLRLLLSTLLLITQAVAAGGVPKSHHQLIEVLSPIKSLSSRFEQTLSDANNVEIQKVQGVLSVARPGLLNWRTEPPYEQLIIADGERLWLYDPDLQQVTSQAYQDDLARTPALLLVGKTEGLKEHYQVFLEQTDSLKNFTLIPLGNDSLYSKIQLHFQSNIPTAMILWDSLGQQTEILFSELRLNPTTEASLFTFEAPEGVDIIYND